MDVYTGALQGPRDCACCLAHVNSKLCKKGWQSTYGLHPCIHASPCDSSAVVAGAVGALYGPLHGGANEAVLRMLQVGGRAEWHCRGWRDAVR